jgi:hypothetical protein
MNAAEREELLLRLGDAFRADEPHPGHPSGYTEAEPWCHACSPKVSWRDLRALLDGFHP